MGDIPDHTEEAAPASGARCGYHPEVQASGVCKRCGTYACPQCLPDSAVGICQACRSRLGTAEFPLTDDNWNLTDAFDYSLECFKRQWLNLCLLSLVHLAVIYGLSVILALAARAGGTIFEEASGTIGVGALVVTNVGQMVIQMGMQVGLLRVYLDVLMGREAEIALLFRKLMRAPSVLFQMFLFYLVLIPVMAVGAVPFVMLGTDWAVANVGWLGLAAVLVSVPMTYLFLPMLFAQFELAYSDDTGAIQGIRNAFSMIRGRRWRTIGIFLVTGLIMAAGMLACCVGIFAAMPVAWLLLGCLYLSLRNQALPGQAYGA